MKAFLARHEKILILLGLYAFWMLTYLNTPHLRLVFPPRVLPWDPVWRLPVAPMFIVPYQSAYLMPFVLLAAGSDVRFLRRFAAAMAAAITVSLLGFIFISLVLPFPVVSDATIFGRMLNWQRQADTTGNYFPSLHVSMSMLMALAAGRLRPGWRIGMVAWAALIAASTLFTRMHYLVDVVGGLAVAATAWLLFMRRTKVVVLTPAETSAKVPTLL